MAQYSTPAVLEMIGAESLDNQHWVLIGKGGFGQVFKARHNQWGWDVAVKLLGLDGTSANEDLVNEAELMRLAESPYVMKVLGSFRGSIPTSPMKWVGLIMEVMERGSLGSLQAKLNHMPPWPLVFRLVHQVALGMNYLHSLTTPLIHKDLKPQNVLLDRGLNVKITDFGLARLADRGTLTRLQGAQTPFFTPPEGLPASCAWDVYSYGILVWSILNSGHTYFKFEAPKGERPPLDEVNRMMAPGLEELKNLMERCWDQTPDQRPSFAECTDVTEVLYTEQKHGINDAVHQVQMELDERRPPPVPLGSTNRDDFLKHSCSLSLDPFSMNNELSLSEDNRKVTNTEQDQDYPDDLHRFTHLPQVLSRESLSERCYFEVEWSGHLTSIAVSSQDINRKDEYLSGFGRTDKSWLLWHSAGRNWSTHNGIKTKLSSNVGSNDGGVFGVYVDHKEGTATVSFYSVSNNTMSLLHTVETTSTQPLYAGIYVPSGTAELRQIW